MKFFVDFPNPDDLGKFICLHTAFNTREEAAEFCTSWGAVDGKVDLITEVPVGGVDDVSE